MTTATRKSLAWIPDTLDFYPHQIEGVRWLAVRASWLLADEMGLGKSVQALTVFAIDVVQNLGKRALVVAPATLKGNWVEEIQKNTNFPSQVLDGTPKQRATQIEAFAAAPVPNILIVNYEQVIAHLDALNALDFDAIIYDEAHYLKNPKAVRTKACQGLVAKRHFLLTGSPMLNQVDELWSLLFRIDPKIAPKYWPFRNRYCVFGGYKNKQIIGIKNEKELKEKLHGVMLRREKKEVLDLPDKQYITVHVELSPEQRTLYREIKDEMKLTLPVDPGVEEIDNALTKFLRLKQVCGTTACFEGWQDISWKLDRIVEDATQLLANGERVVVFTQFRGVLAALEERFRNEKPSYNPFSLHGDVPIPKRVGVVQAWRDHPKAEPLVCMLQVAGVGLNLTAARTALFADKLFVPKLNEQAEDRLHRIGADKTQPVQIRDYITTRTIESRIEAILRHKTKIFDTVVADTDFKRKLVRAILEEDD